MINIAYIIDYQGDGYSDFLLYLVSVMNNCNKKICIIDRTIKQSMFKVIPFSEGEGIITYRGVDFSCNDVDEALYDYIFVYKDEGDTDSCSDTCIINSGVLKQDIEHVQMLQRAGKNLIVVLRDVVSSSFGRKYLLSRIEEKNIDNMSCFEVYQDIIDYGYRVKLDYTGYAGVGNLSWNFCKVITEIICLITHEEKKVIMKGLKLTREGKISESSILQ